MGRLREKITTPPSSDGAVKVASRPVGEVRGHLHHLSDGIGVGPGHSADVEAGVAVLLHLEQHSTGTQRVS